MALFIFKKTLWYLNSHCLVFILQFFLNTEKTEGNVKVNLISHLNFQGLASGTFTFPTAFNPTVNNIIAWINCCIEKEHS